MSGLIEAKNPMATVEELNWVNVTREKKKEASNETNETVASSNDSTQEEANATANESGNSSNSTNKTAVEYEVVQKQKKKKHEKKLTVKRMDYRPVPLSDDDISESRKLMESLAKEEEEVKAVHQIKNELEAAIYGSRDKVEREDIVKVSTEEQREEVVKLCTEYEEWMYEGGTAKSEYESRLNKLKDLLGPMEERSIELESREDVSDKVKSAVAAFEKYHTDLKKNKTWVNETKLETTLQKLTEFQEWWNKKEEQQKALPLHEALPDDPKKVEEMLKAVRDKKAAAVENEDFDAAQALKVDEKKLKAHLETLEGKSEL